MVPGLRFQVSGHKEVGHGAWGMENGAWSGGGFGSPPGRGQGWV